jgi:hypothetical protein
MQLQHDGEDDAMENDIVFPDKMYQLGCCIFPVRSPVLIIINGPLFSSADIPDRGIKPNIKDFSLNRGLGSPSFGGVWGGWNFYPPFQISCYCS